MLIWQSGYVHLQKFKNPGFNSHSHFEWIQRLPKIVQCRLPRPLNGNLTAYPNTMSLTPQSALNHFKTHFLDMKMQAIKGTKFSLSIEKSILGCFHPSQNPTGTWILGMIFH